MILSRLSDSFAEAARICADLQRLGELLGDAATELGFDYFALVHHAALSGLRPELVRMHNYPDRWLAELLECRHSDHDPVHLASRRTNIGFLWRELSSLVRLDRTHARILARSRHHGLGEGFTIPANIPGEPPASCSFAVRAGCGVPESRLRCAEVVGAHALNAARRLCPATRAPPPRLSRREVECLRLVAIGKTDWEIARIIGISRETARQYVKRARAAYQVVSRTQLAVHGLRDGLIAFEDAIPPIG